MYFFLGVLYGLLAFLLCLQWVIFLYKCIGDIVELYYEHAKKRAVHPVIIIHIPCAVEVDVSAV